MPLLTVTNLNYVLGTRVLLSGVSFTLEPGERVGLVGRNGAGKSTLMKVITGRLKADSGSVSLAKGVRCGYLTQDPELDPDKTLREEAAAGFQELNRLHTELDGVFHGMADLGAADKPGDAEKLDRLLKRQSELQERIDAMGGYAVDHKVDEILHGLGFSDGQFGIKVRGLSGGQKGRLALARLLLESPDLLLLDEPTNHLDIAGREWLEEFLINDFRGAVIMVSHDRYMLDRVVTRIEEIEQARLIEYPGNYTAFREIRAQRLLTQHRAYENQQSQWAKEEEFIRRFRAGQRAKEAQGRLSKLERQKELFALERPVEVGAMRMKLPEAPRSGDQVAIVREAAKAYPPGGPPTADAGDDEDDRRHHSGRELFRGLNVTISRGERWGIIGPNGAGKTTLVKALLGQLPLSEGTAKLGANVIVGYYAQLPPEADGDLVVYEYLQRQIKRENPASSMSEQAARDLAGAFLFSGEDQDKRISTLSGGERSRARLAALLASAKNLLVLDEPTNHLDIPSAERLERALATPEQGGEFEGTLLLISHDRALIDACCDHLLVLDGMGGVTVFTGDYSEWHEKQVREKAAQAKAAAETAVRQSEQAARRTKKDTEKNRGAKSSAGNGIGETNGRGAGKAERGGGGKSWMSDDKLEKEIERLTKLVKQKDDALADERVYLDAGKTRETLSERDDLAGELEALEAEWLRRAEE